jgi:N-acetylglutamate synthase-like GNAT family acetyltransferase
MIKVIRKATKKDLAKFKSFLEKAGISHDGIEINTIDSFLLLENDMGEVEASIGIEKVGQGGLLRSLVITSSLKQTEIIQLFHQVLIHAADKKIQDLYLVTNKLLTLEFFHLLGFEIAEKNKMPTELSQSEHFLQSIEMENTVFMTKAV